MMIAFFNIGLLFYMLLILVWWMDRSRKKMEGEVKKREAAKAVATEKMVCSECGSDVPADAEKCPQCGERFDDAQKNATAEEKKCPKCNAVIFDTDKKCWNCGTELIAPPKQG
jgi:ribosomal protein L40E